jgi:hypothetical protein
VVLPSAAPGRASKALAGRQSRVRLHEVGPRLELEIVKVGGTCACHVQCVQLSGKGCVGACVWRGYWCAAGGHVHACERLLA